MGPTSNDGDARGIRTSGCAVSMKLFDPPLSKWSDYAFGLETKGGPECRVIR